MAFKRFALSVIIRTTLLFLTLVLLSWLAQQEGYLVNTMFVAIVVVWQTYSLIRFVDKTNTELARFLNSIRHSDFIQSFSIEHLGSGFQELNDAFDDIMQRFRQARSEKEMQARYLKTLVEHIPVAIVAIYQDGKIDLLNNAARKLLNAPGKTCLDDLEVYGPKFQRDMMQAEAGRTKLTSLNFDGEEKQVIISTTQITQEGKTQRLVSVQDIQSQLDATELGAWQDLVRVLSHEIMNSITPIASLARTSADMIEDVRDKVKPENLEVYTDIKDGIETVARRSEGLMHFVKSYRQLTQMPPPRMGTVNVADYLTRLETLMRAEWRGSGVAFHVSCDHAGLSIRADEEFLDQAVINLLRNARDAVADKKAPQISLNARLNDRNRVVIDVSDNGAGIEPERAEKIFLPFFTTKEQGSGIGLALTRQIMLVHGGTITAGASSSGGASFKLIF